MAAMQENSAVPPMAIAEAPNAARVGGSVAKIEV